MPLPDSSRQVAPTENFGPEHFGSKNFGPENFGPEDFGPENFGPENLSLDSEMCQRSTDFDRFRQTSTNVQTSLDKLREINCFDIKCKAP